jgi:hypothetical protein
LLDLALDKQTIENQQRLNAPQPEQMNGQDERLKKESLMTINSNRIESSVQYPSSSNLRDGAASFINQVAPKASVHSGSYTVTATVSNSAPSHI